MLAVKQCAACGESLKQHVALEARRFGQFEGVDTLLSKLDDKFWTDYFRLPYEFCSIDCQKQNEQKKTREGTFEKNIYFMDFVEIGDAALNNPENPLKLKHENCLFRVVEDHIVFQEMHMPEWISIQCINGNCKNYEKVIKNIFYTDCNKICFPDISFYGDFTIPNDDGGELILFNSWNDAIL